MIRLCYVIPSLDVGGTERQLVRMAGGLSQRYEITVYCTRHEGALAAEARHHGAAVEALGLGSGWDPRLRTLLRRQFRRHRPDILHTFLSGFDLHANRAARDCGVPVVVSSRREIGDWQRGRHVRRQQKANTLVDCVVANARAVADFAIAQEGLDPARIRVIPNGILADAWQSMADPEQIRMHHGLPPEKKIVCTVANFSPVKDHPLFLATAQALSAVRSDVHFLTVGKGPLWKEFARQVKRSGMTDRFTHSTTTQAVADLLKVSSVFVLCSRNEGFPNAVMEAMAAGRPVVAAAVGGVPELIGDGVTGRLISTRDPGDFAEAVAWCLDHPAESGAIGLNAAAWVREHLTLEKTVEAYQTLYVELFARSARRAV